MCWARGLPPALRFSDEIPSSPGALLDRSEDMDLTSSRVGGVSGTLANPWNPRSKRGIARIVEIEARIKLNAHEDTDDRSFRSSSLCLNLTGRNKSRAQALIFFYHFDKKI